MSNVENTGDDGGASMMGSLMGGANQPLGANAKIGISADTKAVSKLKGEFSSLRAELKRVREEMEGIARASQSIKTPAGGGVVAGIGAAGTPMAGGIFNTAATQAPQAAGATPVAGAGGTPVTAGPAAPTPGLPPGASAAFAALGAAIQGIDQRTMRSYDYSLSADRMSLVYQQMYGMSQNQVASTFRTPMANMLLGAGGINELMAMQATTGISALQQAPSVEAMRIMSGFSLSTGQVTNMINQLAQPDVANRMFMFGGTGLIGPGGQQRDMMQVMQSLTRSAGLTDPRLAKSAMAPGSITRANLTMMGVTGEMQDMVIQYANQNIQYQQRGGRGMYDPRNKEAQKIMGIEDNFAMEAERTDAARVAREEQFYRRQADNFADLEKQTQSLTKAMASLEDKLSGLFGTALSTRGPRNILGSVMKVGGMAAMLVPGWQGVGLGLMAGGAMISGDATGGNDGNTSVPVGYGNDTKPRSQLESSSTFSKLHPTFKQRLLRMIEDNPAVGIGQGFRSSEQQEKMFLDRYRPTSEKTNIYWRGSYWKKVKGANAAPPGRSMHEIGLAADLVGDVDWVVKNAAKYGLKTYEHLGEPWHIQPADLPGSRAEYEKEGAPWGTLGQPIVADDAYAPAGTADKDISTSVAEGSSSDTIGTASILGTQLSIQEQIDMTTAYVRGSRTPGGSGTRTNAPTGSTSSGSTNATPALGGGAMSGEAVAKLLYAAGFRGKDLADALAISWRESHWNPGAFANDEDDLSYGLFQHNMIPGATNPEGNRRDWGIPSNEALFDPVTNVRIAYEKYKWNKSKNKHPFDGWFIDGSHLGRTNEIYSEATRIARQIETTGDPVPAGNTPVATGASRSANVSGNHTFNIAPNITINGASSTEDLQRVAKTVARMLEKEIRTSTLRSI